MILAGVAALLLLALGDGGDEDKQPPPRPAQGSITVHQQQIVIRVPAGLTAPPPATPIRWEEHRGPRCIPWARILAAVQLGQNSVDLLLRDRTRLRARLERRCPALDYYRGFYLPATPDGLICADRDSVRSRNGGQCEIDQFRTLRARPAR